MTEKEINELAERLAKVACDFFHYGFDPDEPKHQIKLAQWLRPELEKVNVIEKRKLKETAKNLFNRDEYEEVCPHYVPCVVCSNPVYRKKQR